ncbi:MAG: hypothetical protein KGJ57_04960 [Sphingomonadales bacterium]|nr:hypothetical protein [Sphingomonadales bacterium]MDE2168766.1 hypothetical protein [Sphingomonadales bacterium]
MSEDKATSAPNLDDLAISVRRHPQDWQTAQYSFSKLEYPHLDRVSGGVGRGTAHPTVFCYVWCDGMLSGELAHSCSHGPAPHRIKVAVPKVCNTREAYARVRAIADANQAERIARNKAIFRISGD